ncbi:MAG: hypothetical protein E4G96_10470 [Chrysiogenales bacterium]|nr:MAG: hypothetical protein E4G96_10470 [Chrysiogenales bacterium]
MKYFLPLFLFLSITGCITLPKNLRTPDSAESAVIGVSIRTVTLRIFKNRQNVVYFVKLDGPEEGVIGSRVFPANFVKGDHAYLVNARPGRYVAVASVFFQSENSYNSFFDRETIQSTAVDAGPGDFIFMGSLSVGNHLKSLYQNIERHGDREQLHYYNLLKPVMYGTFYTGSLLNMDRSPGAERSFLVVARDHFKDSDWLPHIGKRAEALEKDR